MYEQRSKDEGTSSDMLQGDRLREDDEGEHKGQGLSRSDYQAHE